MHKNITYLKIFGLQLYYSLIIVNSKLHTSFAMNIPLSIGYTITHSVQSNFTPQTLYHFFMIFFAT